MRIRQPVIFVKHALYLCFAALHLHLLWSLANIGSRRMCTELAKLQSLAIVLQKQPTANALFTLLQFEVVFLEPSQKFKKHS